VTSHAKLRSIAGVTERVSIAALLPADSPRTAGTSLEHVRRLATPAVDLPPIVVHRPSMRVVDGMHRLAVARARGDDTIAAQFVDVDAADVFVLAVELNQGDGLPLTLADRTAAAARIIESHREWSDRRIAAVTGLAANTVGAIRRRAGGREARLAARVGRDGRTRPGSTVQARLLASELIADNPGASLREIARAVGMSPATAGDVRARLLRGESPITPRQRVALREERSPLTLGQERRGGVGNLGDVVPRLRSDPSLRFTDGGRVLLRALDACVFDATQWERIAASVPSHHRAVIVELVRRSASAWQEFADRLVRQPDASEAMSGPA